VHLIKDKDGGEWRIPSLSLGLMTDLRDVAGIDFLQSRGGSKDEAAKAAGDNLEKLYDPFTLGASLWLLLSSQAIARGIDEKAFAYLFDADCYDPARLAILYSAVDFIHPRNLAAAIKADLPGLMTTMDDALIAVWKSTVGGSPGSPAPTTPGLSV